MFRFNQPRSQVVRWISLPAILLLILGVSSCGGGKVSFVYPDEAMDFQQRNLKMPAIYIDTVTDMRPIEQRQGEGSVFKITYPSDESWEVPATQIYAEALAKDLEQTHLVELVPLHAQADYILSVDLLSMGCQLKRSVGSFLLTGGLGAAVGYALGDDASHSAKLAVTLGVIAMVAIPVPTKNHAEAEVRMTMKDRTGNVVWQKTCLGELDSKKYVTPTSRQDQELVNEYLTQAVKKANACLLGQLRQEFMDHSEASSGD